MKPLYRYGSVVSLPSRTPELNPIGQKLSASAGRLRVVPDFYHILEKGKAGKQTGIRFSLFKNSTLSTLSQTVPCLFFPHAIFWSESNGPLVETRRFRLGRLCRVFPNTVDVFCSCLKFSVNRTNVAFVGTIGRVDTLFVRICILRIPACFRFQPLKAFTD